MTDDLTDYFPQDAAPSVETVPRVHRHRFGREVWHALNHGAGPCLPACEIKYVCERCGRVREEAAYARGRSARRLGGNQERRIERVYGPTKIGERGDPVDHLGVRFRWQSKATRHAPPIWLAAVSEPTYREHVDALTSAALAAMEGHYGGRESVVIRSFVRSGVPVRDWLIVSTATYGDPRPGYMVIPGSVWLDLYGLDSPREIE